ncbi:hypothetical protein LPJ66_000625 [Kickxella alabastrina]|uniref:Uncharacterized protein n=1 Tax=Kickxella alabastrina TaxID=61397 RepID=A0ACC1IVK3_9FUNG|nr:hypothetical protein LPJ66_000625 [Kickxella alabastrina]
MSTKSESASSSAATVPLPPTFGSFGQKSTAPAIPDPAPATPEPASAIEPLASYQRVFQGLDNLDDTVEAVEPWLAAAEHCFGLIPDATKLTIIRSKLTGAKVSTLRFLNLATWSEFKEELFDVLGVEEYRLKLEADIWAKTRYKSMSPREALAQAKIDYAMLVRAEDEKKPANIDRRILDAVRVRFPEKLVGHVEVDIPLREALVQLKDVIKTSVANNNCDGWPDYK